VGLENIPDEELKKRFISLWECIYVHECYGGHDVVELIALANELERRGYEVTEVSKPRIRRVK
jgi:hypothetical protein